MAKRPGAIEGLTDLPNIGKTVAAKLIAAGVATPQQLRQIGSVEAALRIRRQVGPGDEAPARAC